MTKLNNIQSTASLSTSDLLMCILIFITAAIGVLSLYIQYENVQLQKSIYKPHFTTISIDQPTEITSDTLARVSITNMGYIPGSYNITVKSNFFHFHSEAEGKSGKEFYFGYKLKHGNTDEHELTLSIPNIKILPVLASYEYIYSGDNDFHASKKYCFQRMSAESYTAVRCQ